MNHSPSIIRILSSVPNLLSRGVRWVVEGWCGSDLSIGLSQRGGSGEDSLVNALVLEVARTSGVFTSATGNARADHGLTSGAELLLV